MNFKHVILECPYDSWFDAQTQLLFCKMIALRLSGYLREYPYGTLPFDTSDFVATQHLICKEEERGGLDPIMCWKSITLERCETHNLVFPPLAMLRTIEAPDHLRSLEQIIASRAAEPRTLAYSGGLTVRPEMRKDRALMEKLWELYAVADLAHDLEKDIRHKIGFAAVRFKMLKRFGPTGYKAVTKLGSSSETLAPVSFPSQMKGHPATLIERSECSDYGRRLIERYRFWWKARIVIKAIPLKSDSGRSNAG